MTNSKCRYIIIGGLLLCLLFWSVVFAVICSAAEQEKTYTITETQLVVFETKLTTVQMNLDKALYLLKLSQTDSEILKKNLAESNKEILQIQSLLTKSNKETVKLNASLTQAETNLQNANQLLNKLEKEHKAEVTKIKNQRNLNNILLILAVGVAIAK